MADWTLILQQAGLPIDVATETLIDGQIQVNARFSRELTQAEVLTYLRLTNKIEYRKLNSRNAVIAIPNWATWTEAEVLAWMATNIGTPLATPIPANPMTVQQIRAVLVNIVAVMGKQYLVEQSLARMIVAMRDQLWPDL